MTEDRKVLILTTNENFSDFQLDLGDIPPAIACVLLQQGHEFLSKLLPYPVIKSYGEVVVDPYEYADDDD